MSKNDSNLVEYAALFGGLIGGLGSWAFFNANPDNIVTIYCFKGAAWILEVAGTTQITVFKASLVASGIIAFLSMIGAFFFLDEAEIKVARWLGKRAKKAVDAEDHEMPVEEEVKRCIEKFGRD